MLVAFSFLTIRLKEKIDQMKVFSTASNVICHEALLEIFRLGRHV